MTVDVEDYFQVSAFESHIDRNSWDQIEHRVEKNTYKIIEIFDHHQIKATFFTLAWIAERYPALIKEIVNNGHEIASHGYQHIRVTEQSPTEFQKDIQKSKKILEDITGLPISGYRAASYSIGKQNLWALEILQEEGFLYSSSIYPVKHDLYGMPNAPRFAFYPANAPKLLEIPITTLSLLGKNFPCGGGGFFRLYPYQFSKHAFRVINHQEKQAGIFYFHPWEIDVDQPRVSNLPLKSRFRHYLNLYKVESRLHNLLHDFKWDTIHKVFLTPNEN